MELTIALERYDRHVPFFDGTVKPRDGVTLKVFQVGQSHPARDGEDRHGRMLKGEFDAAEFSMSTYLMAIDRGLPITGVPVFPRRLFSAGLFFVREDSPLRTPGDLRGKRVAIRSFQTTLSLLPAGVDVGHLLRDGKVDAVIQPHPPKSMTSGAVPIRRLIEDADAEELRYFKKYGYFPIMHILAIKPEAVARNPALPVTLMAMFADARAIAADYYSDPN